MYARHLSFLVTLSAACLLSGCLFFSDEEAGESQGNNTIPTEDMMTPPVADMGDMEVDTPEEDMPQTDMKVEIGCSSNDQCDDSEVCIDEVCQAPQCDPAAEQSMCPANQGCLQGQCIDLLANNEHCGAIGAACAQGTACAAGMCVCEAADTDNRMNFNTIAKSNLEDLQHYPSAQMITFNTEERYICTAPDTDELKECPNDQVQLNLEYPVDAPHYLVALTTGKKQLSLRLLDERGQQIPGTFPLNGDSDQFEDELVNYRLLATGLRQNLLIVWWRNEEVKEGEPTNFIKLYEVTVTPDNAVTSKPVLDEDDQPFVPLQQDNLRDFGLTFAEAPVGGVEGAGGALYLYIRQQ